MIVLDEQLSEPRLAERIAHWHPGQVVLLTSLRSGSIVKDDAVQKNLLRKVSNPTFLTINVKHFWDVVDAETRFAIVCVELRVDQLEAVSDWLREFLSTKPFNTKAGRMGIVALVRPTRIEFYRLDGKIHSIKRTRR